MNQQQYEEVIRLYKQGYGYKSIARKMNFKSATSVRRVITRAGLNDKSRACIAPGLSGPQQQAHQEKGAQGTHKDYSKDQELIPDAKRFAQRQTGLLYTNITDVGFVLTDMPILDIEKLDPKFYDLWEDVEAGALTEQEADRLGDILNSDSGLFEVRTKNSYNDTITQLGFFERAQIIELISSQTSFDDLLARGVAGAIQEATINDSVLHAPAGFNHEAARLSGEIQKTKSSLHFCKASSHFFSAFGMQPTQEMLNKDEQEQQVLQAQLVDLQKQWLDRFGSEYEAFIENQQPLLSS